MSDVNIARFKIPKQDTDHLDLFYNTTLGLQYCGEYSGLILPWFSKITGLINENEPELAGTTELIQVIADAMDETYGYGGFSKHSFNGVISLAGVYNSQDGDEPLTPMITAVYENVTMRVYDYSIVSLVDTIHGTQKISRFD